MATDLSGAAKYPGTTVITLGGSNVATEVVLPDIADAVTVQFRTNAGKVAWTGTDAAAVDAAHNQIAADTLVRYTLSDNRSKIRAGSMFLASATGSTVAEITLEVGRGRL